MRAYDQAGNGSDAVSYSWQVTGSSGSTSAGGSGSGQAGSTDQSAIKISGSVSGLTPGHAKLIRLRLTNPNDVLVFVTSLTVTPAADSTPAGCKSAGNLEIFASDISDADPLPIPAGASVTLTSAPRAPEIMLVNLAHVNQNVCRNKSFTLTYSASAHS